MSGLFRHETLDVYRLALEVARWVRKARFPRGDAELRKQLKRAADSVVLNLAEGLSYTEGSRRSHLDIAKASAAEASAALDLCGLEGSDLQQAKLRRVKQMLRRL